MTNSTRYTEIFTRHVNIVSFVPNSFPFLFCFVLFCQAGGAYPYEFINVAGDSCEKEKGVNPNVGELICFEDHSGNATELYPAYLEIGHGSPHYCSKDAKAADTYNDFCPYIFFGPNRGQYRHPHIAFASVETYLANLVMPDKCGITWDDSNQ